MFIFKAYLLLIYTISIVKWSKGLQDLKESRYEYIIHIPTTSEGESKVGWKKALLPMPQFDPVVQVAYNTALHGLCRKRRRETETLLRQLSESRGYANQRDARRAVLHLDMVRHLNEVKVKAVQEALLAVVLRPQGAENALKWLHESAQGVDMKLRLAVTEALSFLELRRQWDGFSR